MKCPVCNTETDAVFCPECGFDRAKDFTLVPAFAVLHHEDVEALEKRYAVSRQALAGRGQVNTQEQIQIAANPKPPAAGIELATQQEEKLKRQAEIREEKSRQAEVKRQEEERLRTEARRKEEERQQAEARRLEEERNLAHPRFREQLILSNVDVEEKKITYRQACEGCNVTVNTADGKRQVVLGSYPRMDLYIPVMNGDKTGILSGTSGKPLYLKLKMGILDWKQFWKTYIKAAIILFLVCLFGLNFLNIEFDGKLTFSDALLSCFLVDYIFFWGKLIFCALGQISWKMRYNKAPK